jgi:uncharacterized protein YqgQ
MKKAIAILVLGLFLCGNANAASIVEELTKLNNLYKEGAITKEEFSKAKSILLKTETKQEVKVEKKVKEKKERKKEIVKKENKIKKENIDISGLTLSEEDALKAQIFGCWRIPLGLPYNENLLVRIKLKLKPDGTLIKTEILDQARMNTPGQKSFRALAESALRAIQLCQPLKVPTSGYERWKNLQLNFDAREMLGG